MSTTTTKRGSGAKFLALLASLTMMIAGLVGVALAAPASAAADKVWICHADTNNGEGQPDLGHEGKGGEYKNGFNLIETAVAAWDNGHKERHPNDREATAGEVEQGYCGPRDTKPVYWCDGGEGQQEFVQNEWVWSPESAKPAEGVTVSDNKSIQTEACEPAVPTASATATCKASLTASVDAEGYDPDELEVVVTVDGSVVSGGSWSEGTFAYTQTLTDTAAHTIKVDVYFKPGTELEKVLDSATASNADCTPKIETCEDRGDCPQEKTCEELGNCPTTTEEPPAAVVEAAVVAAPVLPATVTEAPTAVAVPAAATLPAAVPAGEGSDTGLPMWALAMVAAGMIGAAFAGKQLLGARK